MNPTPPPPDDEIPHDEVTEEIVAYLDGELDPTTAESIATRMTLDPHLRAQADALQRTWDILDILPRPEPSPSFATRTLTQVLPSGSPLPPSPLAAGPSSTLVPVMPPAVPSQVGFWVGTAAILLGSFGLGFLGHSLLHPRENEDKYIVEDGRLMRNMRLYRHIDDIDYLEKLNSSELFGEEE
jgi:anti-sigma factor RsiW